MIFSFLDTGFTADVFQRLAESLLHFLWQGSVLAAIVLLADWSLRGSARWRYAVHVAALLLMLACVPVTYAVLEGRSGSERAVAVSAPKNPAVAIPVAASEKSQELSADQAQVIADKRTAVASAVLPPSPAVETGWEQLRRVAHFAAPYAVVAYLLGVALMFGRLVLALMSGHRLCAAARPVIEENLLAMVARQARKIGLRTIPVVAWCGRTSVPLVAGLVKPMILLPVALASSLTPDQLEALLAHELAHLRRFDLLVNLLQRVAESFLFFHPAVWYVSRRISNERENCCDDSVLRAGWGRVEYADALVRMAEIGGKLPAIGGANAAAILAAAGDNPSQFKRRILRLLGEQESLRLGVSRGMAVAILGGILAVILAIPVLFSAPSLVAENERNEKEESSKDAPAKNDAEPKTDREPEVLPGHYRVSFQNVPWKEVLAWYERVMGDRIETQIVPEGNFSYESPRPLDHREISLLINRELLSRDYCLAAKDGGFSVQPAEVIARQYAEQLRKDFMHGFELRKGPDKFESYFEVVECRNVGRTKPPAPAGPAISYVLKASRDFSAQEATSFFAACFADSGFPSVTTGESVLADGFAVRHGEKWLGKTAPALKKGDQIEVWQNYAQEWNSRAPRDYHLVVRGLIVANGKPVAGARVQKLLLEGAPDGPEGEKLRGFLNWAYGGEPIVDKDGKFQVSINQYTQFVRQAYFHVSAPGLAPHRVGPIAIDAAKPAAELKIEMRPGFSGRLRLVLPDGKPLDKGEVDITVQDDLWAWSQPMAKLPVGGNPIAVPNCPAGPLLLKVRVPGFVEQEIRDVMLVEDKVVEVKVAPKPTEAKPLEPKPNDDKPKEVFYFRGKEALERIESVKPKWGKSQHGIEFGLARLDDKRLLHADERVRLEMFIRNTGKESVKISLAADFHAIVPEIKDERGEAVKVEGIFLSGSIPLYQETLKPGEAFGFRHLGLGLGPRTWPPQWAEPKPGKYTLRHTHKIDVDPVDESKPGNEAEFTSGTIEFEVVAPPAAKAPAAEDPKVAPKPQEKFPFRGKEALERIESVKPAWGESENGIQFGIARLDDKREYHSDERVRLELFIRNTGKETVKVKFANEFFANVPEVKDERGEAVKLESIALLGRGARYQESLKPGEAFVFRHFGVGLGPRTSPPHWAEPKPGKYTLRHTHEINVDPVDESKPGKGALFTTGAVEFEVAAPPAAKAPDEEVPKVAPKPKEAFYFRGKEALERIESVKPGWSQPQNDIEFGIARIGEKDRFYNGERVPLEMFVRNVGEKSVKVQLAADFLANVPEVTNDLGEAVKVESVFAAGGVALIRETLKPGEAFGFRHLGLGLGPNPAPGKENWIPFWAEPKAGHATLRHTHQIDVEPADESKPGTSAKFTSKVIHFYIAPADEAKPPRDGVHRMYPNPKQKDYVIEQNYKDGQLHGPSKTFNRGVLEQEENYKEGKLNGFKRSFRDGKTAMETNYKDGKPEGISFSRYRMYDAKGFKDIKVDRQYLTGKPVGAWTWQVGEERIQVKTYKDGVLNGLWERKSEDGKKVQFRLTYENGNILDEGDSLKAMPFLQRAAAQAKAGDTSAKRMAAALQSDVDLEYFETPVADVVIDLGDRFNIPMFVDHQAAEVLAIGETKIVVNEKQTPLFYGLNAVTAGHGLTFDYRFHALWLTTPKAAADWKDPTGVSDLKPAAGSPLAKALPELPKFDLLATPIAKLAEPFQKEYGLTLDASRIADAKWTGPPQPRRRESRVLSFRDSLSILLCQNHCRCREEGGKLIIEPVGVPPKEKAEPAKEKPAAVGNGVAPGTGLRINVPALGPAPLALDFAFPINSKSTDQKKSFSFFFGIWRQ